jgi:putative ABC transport system permease protein
MYADFVDWSKQQQSFEATAAHWTLSVNLGRAGKSEQPERVNVWRVNSGFFAMLGVTPRLGRDFTAADDRPGAPRVAILTHELWQRRFGSDPNAIAGGINLDGDDYAICGVLPAGFQFPDRRIDVFTPIALPAARTGPQSNYSIVGLGRLKPGISIARAQAEINAIAPRLNPPYFSSAGRTLRIWGMREFLVRDVRLSLWILLGAVTLVLLIACANVASLSLARAGARQREIAIRLTLGAGRRQVVRQLLTESALLGLLGGAVGLWLAHWALRALLLLSPERYPLLRETRIDPAVLWFTLAVSLATSLLFGLAPAVAASRGNVRGALQAGGRGLGESTGQSRMRSALVVAEVALALVLAAGAGLLIKAFGKILDVNPGFNPRGVLTASTSLPAARYRERPQRIRFYQQVLSNLQGTPGVQAAGMVSLLPLGGTNSGTIIHVENRPEVRANEAAVMWMRSADAGYFHAMEIPLRRGRLFNVQDIETAPAVVIVNETMARRYWPAYPDGEEPVGKRLAFGLTHRVVPPNPAPTWITIVGIVGDVRHMSLAQAPLPEIYLPFRQSPQLQMTLVARTAGPDPLRLAPSLRAAVAAVDREQPLARIISMEQVARNSVANRRLSMLLLTLFASVAMALAVVGIYGVVSYSVTRRTREIGVRLALGAQRGDVLAMIVRQGLTLALAGAAIGVVVALSLTRVMNTMLFGTTATDPLVFAAAALLLTGVAAFACYIPARRATKVDPAVALRYE